MSSSRLIDQSSSRQSRSESLPPSDRSELDLFSNNTDEDDDDIDYVPADDGNSQDSMEEDDEDSNTNFHDAEEDLSGLDIEFPLPADESGDDHGGGEDGEDDADMNGDDGPRRISITRDQMIRLLGHPQLRQLISRHIFRRVSDQEDGDEDQDSEPDTGYGVVAPRRRRRRARKAFEKVPSDEGRKLMESGIFGANDRHSSSLKRRKRLAYKLMQRELNARISHTVRTNKLVSQGLIPSTRADTIIHYDDRCYSGQFSRDGNFFFSCAQDFKVRMYDTSNPYKWKYYKTVDYPDGSWTITDASLSPDNRFLAYSSIRNVVYLANTDPGNDADPYPLDFSDSGSTRRQQNFRSFPYFSIWSLRFSGDGREIVAGTGDRSVYVYDIETNQSILRIAGHDEDVNAVCFGDTNSPHILFSGSDDTTLKVWDRRSLGDGREAGVFLGHTEGLTYVDSKGDGRYVLSNGKDQTAKLWDLRKMISKDDADKVDINAHTTGFEYRRDRFDFNEWKPHPRDCSLVTFRGHSVLKTLIRCHFSPPGSTDSRYVYSGSYDGSVYVWNLDATLAGKVDVLKATANSRPRDPMQLRHTYEFIGGSQGWQTCVRDASWHPDAPVIAATAWNGWGLSQGTCSVHTWNDGMEDDEGEPPMGRRVNARLGHEERFYRNTTFDDDD